MAGEEQQPGADIDLNLAGQRIAVKNVKSLNTILTAIAAVGIGFVVYLLMFPVSMALEQHRAEAVRGSELFVSALKEQTKAIIEQTAAQREATCILRFDQKDRPGNSEFCRTISGATR